MVWGYVAGAVAGAALDYMGNRANQDRQNQATRELWRQAPSDQMEGFRRAGLNPMLAYGRIDFPGSSANYAPSNFGGAITQGMQAHASQTSADAAVMQANTSAKQVASNIELQKAQTAKAFAEAGFTERQTQSLQAYVNAVSRHMGSFAMDMNPTEQALSEYIQKNKLPAEIQAARSAAASKLNEAELQEFINMPATNALMKAAQMLMRLFLSR